MDDNKKLTKQETLRAVFTGIKLAFSHSPWFLGILAIEEVISRLAPFANALILAKLVSALPGVTTSSGARHDVVVYIILLTVVSIVPTLTGSLGGIFRTKLRVNLDLAIRKRLQTAFAFLPYVMYEDKETIDAYERATRFANNLSNFVLYRLRNIFGALLAFVISAIAFWNFSPWLTLTIFALTMPTLWVEFKLQKLRELTWRKNTLTYRKANAHADLVRPRMIKESRLLGLVSIAIEGYQKHTRTAEMDQVSLDLKSERYHIASLLLGSVIELTVLLRALQRIVAGNLPIGQFVFVQQIASQYLGSLRESSWLVQDLDDLLFGASEYSQIINYPTNPEGEEVKDSKGDIVLEDVSFSYPLSDKPAIQDISITIHGGQTIAIVGENGAGKTTLVKLLMKLYDPSVGSLTVGGQALKEVDGEAWHRRIGVLFQDFSLFYDFTIRDNVWFGDVSKKQDSPRLKESMNAADASDFAEKLPKGLDTYLGKYIDEDNGTDLSGGQSQRLAIARTLFRDPDVLILDEPTSSVDAKAEYKIFEALEKARKGRTTILISHRFSTVRRASYIFVLENGRLKEQGTHNELMKNKSLYHEMFTKQAEGYR